ncbi:MAG TPA: YeeE/YedE family protein [Chloroflexi bacterium]|nr:YeeE/YedE family protein [Chloroflexota bacterium]
MAPFPLEALFGKFGMYAIYLAIGFGFGFVLEISGFANSKKLAAQFYFKDMTVLKVMFTGIIVAMLLVFSAVALGLLDYNRVWVNLTYLWPGIVGGLIMGFGFIIGGFCPGTSLVAAATAKIDGIFFVLGVTFGIFIFGETVQYFEDFFYSSFMGRFTLPELFGLPTGVTVLGVVLMALFMFWGGEQLEKIFGGEDPAKAPKLRYAGAGVTVLIAVLLVFIGQPTTADKWDTIAAEKQPMLDNREVQVHPAEALEYIYNDRVDVVLLDIRSENDYNLFHIQDAQLTSLDELPELTKTLLQKPANTLFVVMSNDEATATEAWKALTAESLTNVYILEGGINNWLDNFSGAGAETENADAALPHPKPLTNPAPGDDILRYAFPAALGALYPAATPEPHDFEIEYTPKVKLELKQASGGG